MSKIVLPSMPSIFHPVMDFVLSKNGMHYDYKSNIFSPFFFILYDLIERELKDYFMDK